MYVKIIDCGECFSTTTEFINGVYANRNEWAKHNFYPQNGMVGELVKRRGSAYIIKIKEGIYVPMTEYGIKEIEYEEFLEGQSNNVSEGMNERQRRINDKVDFINSLTGYDWQHPHDKKEEYKKAIIENIEKLTCDYKRRIFAPDLEQSAIIFILDKCIEFQDKEDRDIHPLAMEDIINQVCDVYQQLFSYQFPESSRDSCMKQVTEIFSYCELRDIVDKVDKYYQEINYRYSWS